MVADSASADPGAGSRVKVWSPGIRILHWLLTCPRSSIPLAVLVLEQPPGGARASLAGTGKTHAMAALADRLIKKRRSVLFVPTFKLVQDLLAAKRDLDLLRALRKLDHFEVLILDDLGDLKQRADEAEVLFTLIAERYERRSIIVTTNQ